MAAVACAFLLYSGIAKIPDKNVLMTLANPVSIHAFDGYVCSNPVKSNYCGRSYRACFRPERAYTKEGSYSADGKIEIYFPASVVESFYPGKLYTAADLAAVIEDGAQLLVEVQFIHQKKGSNAVFTVKSAKPAGWHGNRILRFLYRIRALCRLQFKRLMYGWGSAGGFFLALLSGSREYTEQSVADGFKNAGLAHILALSGMHLELFGGLAFLAGKKFISRKCADVVRIFAVIFFVWFAGISPSLLRAFISAIILFVNSRLRLARPHPLSVISVCFIVHILVFPSHVFEISFMLSYTSLAGMILFSSVFAGFLPFFLPPGIRKSFADSSAAQAATAPVSMHFFGKVMPVGIVAAAVVSPLVVLFIYAGIAGVIFSLVLPFLSVPFGAIMNLLYFFIKKSVLLFGMLGAVLTGA